MQGQSGQGKFAPAPLPATNRHQLPCHSRGGRKGDITMMKEAENAGGALMGSTQVRVHGAAWDAWVNFRPNVPHGSEDMELKSGQ